MKKYLLIIIVWVSQNAFSQNTNVYDFAPSAKVITNGEVHGGGATARTLNSATHLNVGEYIILDCGTPIPLSTITFGTFWKSDSRYIPKGYTIEYSNDGTTWSNLVTITGNQNLSPSHDIPTDFPGTRYWKLTITAIQTGEISCAISGLLLLARGVGAASNNSFWNGGGFGSTSVHYTAGNVGIGTLAPASKLQVSGGHLAASVDEELSGFVQLWSDNAVIWKNGNSHGALRFGSATNLSAANFSEKMRITDGGSVGIGTDNPGTYKLAVEGTLGARKVKVTQASWADYVFHPTYRLRPLSEVEQYIQQHHHLPEVPSAAEVERDGIDLGDNQALLLKKIEELTLYIIEMNKENNKMRKEYSERLNKLETENALLKKKFTAPIK